MYFYFVARVYKNIKLCIFNKNIFLKLCQSDIESMLKMELCSFTKCIEFKSELDFIKSNMLKL